MESNGKWTVVLTPEGEFMKIPSHPHHLEGKEVSFRISETEAKQKKKRSWTPPLMRGVALTAACLLFLVTIFPFFGGSEAYAAVTFDINPSLELEVDEQATVIAATPFNEEAKKLLDTVQWKGQSLSEVTLDIIEQAEQMGYMNEERQVLITATYLEEEEMEKVKETEKENITQILEEATAQADQELTVVIVEGSKEWHEEAKQKQVPPGAYMLVKQAEEQGIELKEKEWQANPIEELPPVEGVTIIHPKGQKDKDKDQVKAKQEDKQEKKEEKKQDINQEKKQQNKQDDKRKTNPDENKAKEVIKENKKEKEKTEEQDDKKVKDDETFNGDRERDDKKESENERKTNERTEQKQSQNEKGPSGPPSHVKKDSSSKPEKEDDQLKKSEREKEKEKDDREQDDKKNEKERD